MHPGMCWVRKSKGSGCVDRCLSARLGPFRMSRFQIPLPSWAAGCGDTACRGGMAVAKPGAGRRRRRQEARQQFREAVRTFRAGQHRQRLHEAVRLQLVADGRGGRH